MKNFFNKKLVLFCLLFNTFNISQAMDSIDRLELSKRYSRTLEYVFDKNTYRFSFQPAVIKDRNSSSGKF